jgi:hypothetical protein
VQVAVERGSPRWSVGRQSRPAPTANPVAKGRTVGVGSPLSLTIPSSGSAKVKSLFLCECLTREHRAPVVHAAAA